MSTAPALDAARARRLYGQLRLIRRFEERCAEDYSAGRIRGFLHLYIGEEAVAVGALEALGPEDAVVSHYREHGHALVRGMSPGVLLAEMYGKQQGCSRGRGGSMHVFDAALRFYGGQAIVGAGLPLAVGMALADHLRQRQAVTACFFGDGAVAEGAFHEALNLAALWRLPVLFVCENNLYAMGTALPRHQAQVDPVRKARAEGLVAESVDGMDVLAVAEAAHRLAQAVRGGAGPHFLECRTYRFRAHSMYDAELYRQRSEVDAWRLRDPLPTFLSRAHAVGLLPEAEVAALDAEVERAVAEAVAFAEAGTLEPVEALTRFVYTEAPVP